MGGGFAFAPSFGLSSSANQSISANWDQDGDWNPFDSGGAAVAGLPVWVWIVAALAAWWWFRGRK